MKQPPIEVLLTRALYVTSYMPDVATFLERDLEPDHTDVTVRRALHRALGWDLCTEVCHCDELETVDLEPGVFCTGSWAGCVTCDENALTYCCGIGEYDICRACHFDRRCTDPFDCGPDACEVYP